jgi:hypothetical protein
MNIQRFKNSIRAAITSHGLAGLAAELGYRAKPERGVQRIDRLLASPHLGLEERGFDFTHSSESFLRSMCEAVGVASTDADRLIASIEAQLPEPFPSAFPILFVDTDFQRSNETVLSLCAMQGLRYLDVSAPAGADRQITIDETAKTIRAHYQSSGGKLPLWGSIQRYHLLFSETDAIEMSVDGVVIGESQPELSYATMRVG